MKEIVPTLDEIIRFYDRDGLIAYKELIYSLSSKIKNNDGLSQKNIQNNLALLTVWPLIEAYKIHEYSLSNDLRKTDIEKLDELQTKFKSLDSQLIGLLSDSLKKDTCQTKFFNPYKTSKASFINTILSGKCKPLDWHVRTTPLGKTKLLHDSQMGGSIYLLGNDSEFSNLKPTNYSFMQRSFVCMDYDDEPILFMDCIEGGHSYYWHINHWKGYDELMNEVIEQNRVHHLFYAIAGAMEMSKVLGTNYIVPRDFELGELAKDLGMRESRVFSKDQTFWKVGLHSKRARQGIYTHTLYRAGPKKNKPSHKIHAGHQLRCRTLESPDFNDSKDMLNLMDKYVNKLHAMNENRMKPFPRTYENLNALVSLNEILQNYPLTNMLEKEKGKQIVYKTQHFLENKFKLKESLKESENKRF